MEWKKKFTRQNLKKAGRLVAINFAVFLSLLLGIEAIVRITMPEIISFGQDAHLFTPRRFGESFGLTPKASGYLFGAQVVTDERGFRIDPHQKGVNKAKTILVLGDSVSMGVGVEVADVYPYLLGRELKDYHLVNASVPGYTAGDYCNVLERLVQEMKFDGVIVGLCLNDFSDVSKRVMVAQMEEREREHGVSEEHEKRYPPGESKDVPSEARVEDHEKRYPNRVVRFLRHINDNYLNFNDLLRDYSRTYILIKTLFTDTSRNWFMADAALYDNAEQMAINVAEHLGRIQKLATDNGKWILFFMIPYEYQLRGNEADLLQPQAVVNKVAEGKGLALIDLYPCFRDHLEKSGQKSQSLYLFHDPMHLSVAGHKIMAEAIGQELKKRKLAQ